jgi:DNA-binding NtrC family response regulator
MRVLLVDDHAEVRTSIGDVLAQLGYTVAQTGSGAEALARIRAEAPDLVLSDIRMPGMDGFALLAAINALDDPPPVALMTAFGDAATGVEALRLGAVDYLRKPVQIGEVHRLVERFAALAVEGPAPAAVDGLVVPGPELARVVALADRLHAARDVACLVQGETGCGKELLARRLHHGGRPPGAGPFIAVNCAAIPGGLFEAELFGYVAGAFTGAAPGGSLGKLAAAAGGTIFLDEVGDLPQDQQAKLLRVIEERAWTAVGGTKAQRLTARVVCATNAVLAERVREGRFREDLFYRLKVGHLVLPPLRARRGDILPLARALLTHIRAERGRGFQRLSSAAEAVLFAYAWPGNVRQLRNLLDEAALRFDDAVLDVRHLAELLPEAGTAPAAGAGTALALPAAPPPGLAMPAEGFDLDGWHRALVAAALARHGGSPVKTAAYLGITRKVLYSLRKRYGLCDE